MSPVLDARRRLRGMARRGRRGDGTVFWSDTDRRWIARYPHGPDAKPLRAKCRTRDEADAKLDGWRKRYGGRAVSGATLDAWWSEWFPSHAESIRASTATSYAGHYATHIGPLLGGIPIEQLDASDVRRLAANVRAKRKGKKDDAPTLSPGTVHLVVRTLSVALNAAVSEGRIPRNVTIGVRLPRIEREPVRPMTPADADAIRAAVMKTWVERPVRVLLGSGMRLGEVLGLDQGDLLLDAGFVRVRRTKTQVRAVPVTADAVAALRETLAEAPRVGPDEPVFFSPRKNRQGVRDRMAGSSVSHALPEIAGLNPHALRHGAATLMLAGGAPMRVISEQLGHRNPALTARVYAHVVPEAQRSAVGSLERSGTR